MERNSERRNIKVEIFRRKELLLSKNCTRERTIVGRILTADIRVPDPTVSRIHAMIEFRDDGTLFIVDLGSRHGIRVGGQKVFEHEIRGGEEILLGEVTLKATIESVQVQKAYQFEGDEDTYHDIQVEPQPDSGPAPAPEPEKPAPAPQEEAPPAEPVKEDVKPAEPVREEKPTPEEVREQAPEGAPLKKRGPRFEEAVALKAGIASAEHEKRKGLEVTVYWGENVLDVDAYYVKQKITVGSGLDNYYVIPGEGLLVESFPLVEMQKDGFLLRITKNMRGLVRVAGKLQPVDEVINKGFAEFDEKGGWYTIKLGMNDIAKVSIGTLSFFIIYTQIPPRMKSAPLLDPDPSYRSKLAISLVVMILLMFTLMGIGKVEIEKEEEPKRLATLIMDKDLMPKQPVFKPPPPEPRKPTVLPKKLDTVVKKKPKVVRPMKKKKPKVAKRPGGGNMGAGARAKGKEGRRGTRTAKRKKGVTTFKKTGGGNRKRVGKGSGHRTPVDDEDILRTLDAPGVGDKLAGVVGGGEGAGDYKRSLKGIGGSGLHDGQGYEGKALKGTGSGGGGKSTVGIGGLSTKGLGGGRSGTGTGAIPGKGGRFNVAIGGDDDVMVEGGLTRAQIDEVVKRHMNEIRYCYEKELQRHGSDLIGNISAHWVINAKGRVKSARIRRSTLGNRNVESCVLDRIRRWKFPEPDGGLNVSVDYPFIFKRVS